MSTAGTRGDRSRREGLGASGDEDGDAFGRTDSPQHFRCRQRLRRMQAAVIRRDRPLSRSGRFAARSGFSFNDIAADRAGTQFGDRDAIGRERARPAAT
jgi:hypothetical protein